VAADVRLLSFFVVLCTEEAEVMCRNLVAVSTVLTMVLVTGCATGPMADPQTASKAETTPELASEISEIVRSYEQYNAQLRKLNLPDPTSLNILAVFARTNTDSIKGYYTAAMSRMHDQCHSIPNCRMSDMIALRVQTMTNYRVVSLQQKDNNLVKLIVVGANTRGTERKVIVDWLLENGKWRINEIISGPPNW